MLRRALANTARAATAPYRYMAGASHYDGFPWRHVPWWRHALDWLIILIGLVAWAAVAVLVGELLT